MNNKKAAEIAQSSGRGLIAACLTIMVLVFATVSSPLADTFPAQFELSSLDGSNGFVLNGIDTDDRSGFSTSGVGDVNGDGIDDLIIGAYLADPNGNTDAGECYVVFGNPAGFPATLNLSSLDGSNGFVLNGIGADANLGYDVRGAGDMNGDGIDDLIIGAFLADPNGNSNAGESYVVFGRSIQSDSDSDGISDVADNCTLVFNTDQRDTDSDGYGNSCDPDLNNDDIVNFADLTLWVPFFNTATSGDADFNGDGFANFADFSLIPDYFLQPPGPSGVAP